MAACPEWSFVSVVLAADKDKEPRVYQPANYVGNGKDTAYCVFCDKPFAALVDRARNHVGGCGASGLAGIIACPGPRALESEPDEAFAARKAQFAAAREKCAKKNAALRDEAVALQKKRALDQVTAPESGRKGAVLFVSLARLMSLSDVAAHVITPLFSTSAPATL